MPPRVDITARRECNKCHNVQEPHEFAKCNTRKDSSGNVVGWSLRSECKTCGSKGKAAKNALTDATVTAAGVKKTVEDFETDLWTLTEGKQSAPQHTTKKYVHFGDISPHFVAHHGTPAFIIAKITDSGAKVAHRTRSGGEAFVMVSECLRALGVRRCTQCTEVKPHGAFAIANAATGQLRGDCKACHAG